MERKRTRSEKPSLQTHEATALHKGHPQDRLELRHDDNLHVEASRHPRGPLPASVAARLRNMRVRRHVLDEKHELKFHVGVSDDILDNLISHTLP